MAAGRSGEHRRGAALALGITVVVVGGSIAIASLLAYDEVIDRFQIDATVDGTTLSVTETIDHDFGGSSRRGIYRNVDMGLVNRPDEPVELTDPDTTFTGEHRYQLGFDLVGIPEPAETGELVYVAVSDWDVPINNFTARIAPDFEVTDASCAVGSGHSFDDCDISVDDDGVVTATVPELARGNDVALTLGAGAPRPAPTLTPPPLETSGDPTEWRDNVVKVALAGVLAGIVGVLLAGRWVRRAGRDHTAAPHDPDEAAFATGGNGKGAPIDDRHAAQQVTVRFVPPEGLAPAQGAVLVEEGVRGDRRSDRGLHPQQRPGSERPGRGRDRRRRRHAPGSRYPGRDRPSDLRGSERDRLHPLAPGGRFPPFPGGIRRPPPRWAAD